MLMLSLPDPLQRWRSDGLRYIARLPGGQAAVRIYDEGGKVDLNAASEQTLRALFNKLLGDDEHAATLVDRIMDWRDPDDLKRLHGAEAKDYLAAGKRYVPQNKNFQELEELQMVLGLNPVLYKKLESLLTIHSGQDGVNPQKASADALQLLFGLDAKTAADFVKQRQASPPSPPPPFVVPPGGIPVAGSADVAFTIYAQALSEDGPGAGIKAIVKRQYSRNNGAPFAFVSWKQQIFGPNGGLEAPVPK
jgi:general secretion pathway protein K